MDSTHDLQLKSKVSITVGSAPSHTKSWEVQYSRDHALRSMIDFKKLLLILEKPITRVTTGGEMTPKVPNGVCLLTINSEVFYEC